MVPLIAFFGRDPFALRLPTVILGTLGVGAIYLLARYLYGWRVAVVAAGCAIGFTWHLNFSRIGLPAIPSLTCDTAAAALLVLGLRSGNRLALGAAGIVGAAGLYFYFSSQFMPLVLAAIVATNSWRGAFSSCVRTSSGSSASPLASCSPPVLSSSPPSAIRPDSLLAPTPSASSTRSSQRETGIR